MVSVTSAIGGTSDCRRAAVPNRHRQGRRLRSALLNWPPQPHNQSVISAGREHTAALRADGTAAAVGSSDSGQCDVSGWSGLIAVSAGWIHTVGLKADGSVVATGDNGNGRCDVGEWTNIVAVSTGIDHTVGLKADGTVVAVGDNTYGQNDVSSWTDIALPE